MKKWYTELEFGEPLNAEDVALQDGFVKLVAECDNAIDLQVNEMHIILAQRNPIHYIANR